MALFIRTVPEMHMLGMYQYPHTMRLEFDDAPMKYEQALAYLQRQPSGGMVIASRGRGPQGGFVKLYFIRKDEELPRWWREYYVVTRTIINDEIEAQRLVDAAMLTLRLLDGIRRRAFGPDL